MLNLNILLELCLQTSVLFILLCFLHLFWCVFSINNNNNNNTCRMPFRTTLEVHVHVHVHNNTAIQNVMFYLQVCRYTYTALHNVHVNIE